MPAFWFWACILGVVVGWPVFIAGWWAMVRLDRHNRRIRLVLGQHEFDNSDPAMWTQGTLGIIGTAESRFQSATWAQAAQKLLREGSYPLSLYAARLCVATEDRSSGQRLTDEILEHDSVQQFIRACEASDGCRLEEHRATWLERMPTTS